MDDDFSSYVSARRRALVRAASYLGPPDEAEDLVQTALIRCYRHWAQVRQADQVDAYVYRVLVTTHLKARRRRWRGEVATDDIPDVLVDDPTTVSDARSDLRKALSGLSADHRTVLVLRFIADLTEQQTADSLGIPIGTVKSRVARAIAAIDRYELVEDLP